MTLDYELRKKLKNIHKGNYSVKNLSEKEVELIVEHYNKLFSAMCCICEVCVDESKWHIKSDEAVEEIRGYVGEGL